MTETRWGSIGGWALDCLRAARERPLWARLLLRTALGRYAYREFLGLQDELARGGLSPYQDYSCQSARYHADPQPLEWWLERSPRPLQAPEPVPANTPPAAALVPPPSNPALPALDRTAIAELVSQHNTHTQREVQAMNKLGVLDQEFFALVNLVLPFMPPENLAQFHAWNYRRQMVIEEVNEALTDRRSDLERLYAEIGRHYGQF